MTHRHELVRGLVIGVLLMMVLRALDWLLNAPVDATRNDYALQVGTMAMCGLTALATWHPNAKLEARLHRITSRT